MDNLNWGQLEQDAIQSISTAPTGSNQARDNFLKVKPGIHKLRILPTGNKLDNLPYLKISQHVLRLPSAEGKIAPVFMLCGSFLWHNLLSKPTNEEKKNNTLIGYLMKAGKMSNEDFKKFQDFGCPICKGYQHMDMHGVEVETKNNLRARDTYMWNVLWRKGQFSGDDKIYIWGNCSKQNFNNIIACIRQDKSAGYFTLDPEKGFDMSLTATGENLNRRYTVLFDRVPSPLNLTVDQIAFDLAEIAITQYRPYQEMLNNLKMGYGTRLTQLGFVPEGDVALNIYPTPESINTPLASQTPQQMAAQQMPVGIQQQPQQIVQAPITQEKKMLDNGMYVIGGMLYSADGKPLF